MPDLSDAESRAHAALQRADAATPEPWRPAERTDPTQLTVDVLHDWDGGGVPSLAGPISVAECVDEADAEFIAAARSDVVALANYVLELIAERPPLSPDAQKWMDEFYADARSGELWKTPSIREQLAEHYERVGSRVPGVRRRSPECDDSGLTTDDLDTIGLRRETVANDPDVQRWREWVERGISDGTIHAPRQ